MQIQGGTEQLLTVTITSRIYPIVTGIFCCLFDFHRLDANVPIIKEDSVLPVLQDP
jgi:hypothetical protein